MIYSSLSAGSIEDRAQVVIISMTKYDAILAQAQDDSFWLLHPSFPDPILVPDDVIQRLITLGLIEQCHRTDETIH